MTFPIAGAKSICFPVDSESQYSTLVCDPMQFRTYLDQLIEQHPELFPPEIEAGYWWHGMIHSKKQQLFMRRIKVLATGEVYQLRPDFLMPYMIGKTEAVEKALYLRLWGVPFEALAYVFGRDENYWYRAYQALGRFSLVGTTIRDPDKIPLHLLADEKHSWWLGERVYLPTTVEDNCILGVDIVTSASTDALTDAYLRFQQEARLLNREYRPLTVNTDGWDHTQAAWQKLFPRITIILCFLHVVLDIQQRYRRSKGLFQQLSGKLWQLYRANNKLQFNQRLRRLGNWAVANVTQKTVRQRLLNLKNKAAQFKVAYDFP